jgi:mannose-6-phosphate isomerase-like protein (cupin superfamily)
VRIRILEDGSTTGHRLGVGEITLPPHTDGPPQHRHARHDEGFYVVSGTASFTVGDTTYDAPAGTLIMVPPGAPHTFANPGDEPTVFLDRFRPAVHTRSSRRGDGPLRHRAGHRLRQLRRPNIRGSEPARECPTGATDGKQGART